MLMPLHLPCSTCCAAPAQLSTSQAATGARLASARKAKPSAPRQSCWPALSARGAMRSWLARKRALLPPLQPPLE